MSSAEIMYLDHDQIPAYVESQAALGRDRVSVLQEIAALRKDVTLLSVADDKNTFLAKIKAAINSAKE
ncbi:hypothetical protein [Aliterella atlantica]|nr:hypothetical protein [Aliterella atlantica]